MIILVGASASGKTEICKALCYKYGFKKFVTTTTREQRSNEINGVDYFFISKDEFLNKISQDRFIEYVQYNGNYYGTEKNQIDDKTVLIVEPSGLKAFNKLNDEHIVSFLLIARKSVRKERMIFRGDDLSQIEERLKVDDFNFNKKHVGKVDFIIPSDDSGILELAEKINQLYQEKINEY